MRVAEGQGAWPVIDLTHEKSLPNVKLLAAISGYEQAIGILRTNPIVFGRSEPLAAMQERLTELRMEARSRGLSLCDHGGNQ